MTRQQQWATRAHEKVIELAHNQDRAKLKTLGMKMPGLIQQSGLIQALVFVQTRRSGERLFGEFFVDAVASVYGSESGRQLIDVTQKALLPEYLAMSRDIIEVSTWIRRFVQIEMKDIKEE